MMFQKRNVLLVTSAAPSQTPFSTSEKRPPIGIGFLISVLREAGHKVFFIDNYLRPSDFLETDYLQRNDIDLVGIYANTICYRDTLRMLYRLDALRRAGKWNGQLVVGGPHASVALDTIPAFVDHVVQGEGERAILDIVHRQAVERVLRYPCIRNLDELPMPAWDYFVHLPYNWRVEWFDEKPVFTMNTSRGCPFQCTFCSVGSIWGKRYSYFSAERIVKEIEFLIQTYGAKGVYFREDNFTLNRKRLTTFCNMLIEKQLNIYWACESRVNTLDEDLVDLMHRAGLRAFYFGVESGSQRVLDFLKKGITLEQTRKAFALCHKFGIKAAASIIVGVPTETEDELRQTETLIREINPAVTWHNVFVGIPNSALYRYAIDHKLYEFIDDRGLVYLKGHDDRVKRFYGNAWDALIPFNRAHPKISVVMSVYNGADHLEEAVQSILKQTYPNFEFIIIDDASTDATPELLSRFGDPRIRIYRNSENIGLTRSLNLGIEKAHGEYIARMDADDLSHPFRFEKQVAYLDAHKACLAVGSWTVVIREDGCQCDVWRTHANAEGLLEANVMVHGSAMIRKTGLQKVGGYDAQFRYAQDYDLWLRMSEVGALANLQEELYYWRNRKESISIARKSEQDQAAAHARAMAHERRKQVVRKRLPLVSVIVPTRNRPVMLAEAIRSIQEQTYPNIEIVVVNDAGGDVRDVISSLNSRNNITYIYHPENQGLAAARNSGLLSAKGEYIAYLDDDDIYCHDHIETLVTFLETSGCKVAYTDAHRAFQKKTVSGYVITHRDLPYSSDFDPLRILRENFIPVLCMMHRRSCLDEVGGFDPYLRRTEDWDLWIRMSRKFSFAHIKKVTCEFRWRTDGSTMMTGDREPFAWAALNMFYKYKTFVSDSPAVQRVHQQIVAGSLEILINALKAGLQANHADAYQRFHAGGVEDLLARLDFLAAQYDPFKALFDQLKELLRECRSSIAPVVDVDRSGLNVPSVATAQPIRLLAFYLPQYHPIPENDRWWGKGFTEWTNVTKAKPLFEGHYQPHRPADLGFYDLRVAEVRKTQADLAKAYGIYGFCYYHYWFGGKLLLERPLQEMLKSGEPDFPFCLCWANENWTRTWDGGDRHILIAQSYSENDDIQHIRYLARIFRDSRYIRIHDKPLFLVYRANLLPNPMRTTVRWREEAKRLGVGEIYLCRVESFPDEHTDPATIGFDAAVEFQPDWALLSEDLRDGHVPNLRAYRYENVVDRMVAKPLPAYKRFPCVTPSWDNTPRRNGNSLFFTEASPAHYERWLTCACSKLGAAKAEERLAFINAWNEWGEGNHLEPDEKFGHGYLEATRRSIDTAKRTLRNEAEAFHARIRSAIMANGKPQDTLVSLLELVEFHPDYAPAYLDLGALFKQVGDTQKALTAYEKACSLEPLNHCYLKCLADFYFVELKRIDDAEALYEKIVSLNPEDEDALLMVGNLATIQRRFEKALQTFCKVLGRNPMHELAGKMFDELEAKIKERSIASDPGLMLEEARVLAQRGRSDRAIRTIEHLLSAFPDHAAAHNDLGCLYYHTANKEKALAHYERAVALDRANTTYRKNLADYYFIEGGDLDKAVKLYLEVISANPKDTEALFALGVISETLGKCNDAVAFYRMVLSAEPGHAAACERLELASRGNEPIQAAPDKSLAPSNLPKVSIIIAVFNKLEYTKKCIAAITRNARSVSYELIVVDNASSDGTPEYLSALSDTIQIIRNPANVGFTIACNQGARIASGEYILFLNNDTEPAAGWLHPMLDLAEADPKIGVIGSKLVFPDGKLQEAGGIIFSDGSGWNYGRHGAPDDPSFDFVREVDYVSGASLLVRHQLLKQLNYFDERYSPGYYEDTDLCFGIRSLGYKVMYCPFSVVVHHEGVSSGTDLKQGMKKYQAINREKFKAKWEMTLRHQHPPDSGKVIQASERNSAGNILIIDPFLPMFDRASGSLRLHTVISLLQKQGYHITFIARDGQRQEAYSANLRKMGVEVYATDGDMLRQMGCAVHARPFDFKRILGARCYQLAILSFYDIAEQYLPLIRGASPETKILIDTVDIHFVREMRQAELSGDPAAPKRAAATKERELSIYAQADGVITVTERDWDHVRAFLSDKRHFVIPNIHPVGEASIDLNGRKGLLFIGNFNHPPNTDAMLYFVDEVFPIVRRTLPDLTLTIVGNNPPKEVRGLASSRILVTGYVPSTEPYLKTARVSVAPLRYGAGMKGKIGEAMAHGLPVVTTSVGAEGMGLVSGRNALIAESPQELAEHIIALCTNDETWRSIASAARQLVCDTCSPQKVDLMIAEMMKQVALIPPIKGTPVKNAFQVDQNKNLTKDLTSIVILTFNQLKYTKECVQSIQQYTPEPHEIIFIDNGSTDGTVKWLKRLVEQHSDCRLIENDSNLGFSKGCNQGIQAAIGEYVLLLNNDVVVTENWLGGLLECFDRDDRIGIVGPMTNHISGPQKVPQVDDASVADLHEYARAFRTRNRYRRILNRRVVGFCMLLKRRLIDEIGLLDESFGSGNFEDDDLCLRACLAGYRNLIAGDVFIHHYGSRTFAGNKINYGSSLSRNRKVFQDKWRQPDILRRFGKRLIVQNGIFHAEDYFRKDDLEKATAAILEAIQQAPDERQLYIQLAHMLVEKKRFDDALGILASLPEKCSDSGQYALMGYCREALGNDPSAEDYADQALALQPASALALNVKGVLAFKRDDKTAAEAWFRRAIESEPSFGESYTNLGSLKWEAGEQDEALAAFERGFILSPTIDDVATAYHTAVVETKSFEKAEAVIREARALHPTHKRLAFLMIALLLQQEKHQSAMSEIEKAMLQFGIDDGILSAGLDVRKRIGELKIDKAKSKRATLSLCMIVKNEEAHLAKCLMSVKPVVDEMIVVDTGSTDRSKDIAAAVGARVFEYPWTNDFSEARNYSLAQASGDWILVLDADEVISTLDHGLLQNITRKRPAKHRAYIMVTRNYTNHPGSKGWAANEGRYTEEEAGAGWVPSPKVRLFANDRRIRFVNPVHELVEPTLAKLGIPIRTCDVPVHHYGRLNRDKLMAKGKEYYRLGIAKIEQTQGDCNALKELAIQASEIGEYGEAVGVWQKVIERQPHDAVAHMNLGFAFLMMRQYASAAEFSKNAMAIDPDLREAALNYAAAEMFAGDIRTAISTLEQLLERHADYPPAMGRLAAAYIVSGRKAEGLRYLEKLNSRGFDCAGAWEEQARAFLSESKHEAAALLLAAAIEKGLGNGRMSHLLAECRSRTDGSVPLGGSAHPPHSSIRESGEPIGMNAGV